MSHNSPLCHQCHRKGQSGMKFTMNVYTLKFKMFNHLPGISCFLWTSHVNTSNQVLNMALTGKQNPKFHSHHCKFLTSFLTPCASHMWNKELTFISERSLYSYNKICPYSTHTSSALTILMHVAQTMSRISSDSAQRLSSSPELSQLVHMVFQKF